MLHVLPVRASRLAFELQDVVQGNVVEVYGNNNLKVKVDDLAARGHRLKLQQTAESLSRTSCVRHGMKIDTSASAGFAGQMGEYEQVDARHYGMHRNRYAVLGRRREPAFAELVAHLLRHSAQRAVAHPRH